MSRIRVCALEATFDDNEVLPMSRAAMIFLAAATLILTCACSAHADQPNCACPARADLAPKVIAEKLYDQLDQSWINRDANQLTSLADPASFVSIDEHGNRHTFADARKDYQEFFGKLRNVHANSAIKDAQIQGSRLVVYVTTENHFEFQGPKGWGSEIRTWSGEESWEQKGGQWKLVQSKTLKSQMMLDPEWVAIQRRLIEDNRPCVYSPHGC